MISCLASCSAIRESLRIIGTFSRIIGAGGENLRIE